MQIGNRRCEEVEKIGSTSVYASLPYKQLISAFLEVIVHELFEKGTSKKGGVPLLRIESVFRVFQRGN